MELRDCQIDLSLGVADITTVDRPSALIGTVGCLRCPLLG
jgi:hypothetical protein